MERRNTECYPCRMNIVAKCLSLSCFAAMLQAQTGPVPINSKACRSSAVQVVLTFPVVVAGVQMSIPVCAELGAGLRVNTAVTPPVIEIDPASLPAPSPSAGRWVIKKFDLSFVPPAVTPGSQLGIPLDFTPIAGSPMIVSFASSRVGASIVDIVMAAGGANPKQLQVTLPNYKPLTVDDVLTVLYQTLEPAP